MLRADEPVANEANTHAVIRAKDAGIGRCGEGSREHTPSN
jgi:hypothetical protein